MFKCQHLEHFHSLECHAVLTDINCLRHSLQPLICMIIHPKTELLTWRGQTSFRTCLTVQPEFSIVTGYTMRLYCAVWWKDISLEANIIQRKALTEAHIYSLTFILKLIICRCSFPKDDDKEYLKEDEWVTLASRQVISHPPLSFSSLTHWSKPRGQRVALQVCLSILITLSLSFFHFPSSFPYFTVILFFVILP